MSKRIPVAALALLLVLLYSCNSADNQSRYSSADAVSTTAAAPAHEQHSKTGYQDELPINSPERKIIKTADLRCRVQDVFAATTHIEQLVKTSGGIVADSKIDNEPNAIRTLPYSQDSLRQLQSYTTTAHLTLRVPVQRLDSVLTDVAAQAAFINNRRLQLSDVSLQYLSNELKSNAGSENDAAGRAAALAHKSSEAVNAGEYADARAETNINRKIENLNLLENVRYATLQLDLYQPERLDAIIVANTDILMKPSISQRSRMALTGGLELLQDAALLLVRIWPLLLVSAPVLIYFKRRKPRRASMVTAR